MMDYDGLSWTIGIVGEHVGTSYRKKNSNSDVYMCLKNLESGLPYIGMKWNDPLSLAHCLPVSGAAGSLGATSSCEGCSASSAPAQPSKEKSIQRETGRLWHIYNSIIFYIESIIIIYIYITNHNDI